MQKAKIKEEGKPAYEADIEDFDPGNKKGAFEASQFTKDQPKFSVPNGHFNLTVDGKTYGCLMLVATHFSISDAAELSQSVASATA